MHHIGKHPLAHTRFLCEQLVNVNAVVTQITTKRAQEYRIIGIEIAFAEFQETTEGTQQGKRLFGSVARKRIEHQINAGTLGVTTNRINKGKRTAVINMFNTQRSHKITLGLRTGGSVDRQAQKLCNLDGCQSDATGRTMNQNGFTLLRSSHFNNGIPGGKECHRNTCGFFKRERLRFSGNSIFSRHDFACKASRRESQHSVARLELGNARTDFGDNAGGFQAHRRTGETVFQRFFRQKSHRPHHIAEVKCRGSNRHTDFVIGQGFGRHALPVQAVQFSRYVKGQFDRIFRICTGMTMNADFWDKFLTVLDFNFGFVSHKGHVDAADRLSGHPA